MLGVLLDPILPVFAIMFIGFFAGRLGKASDEEARPQQIRDDGPSADLCLPRRRAGPDHRLQPRSPRPLRHCSGRSLYPRLTHRPQSLLPRRLRIPAPGVLRRYRQQRLLRPTRADTLPLYILASAGPSGVMAFSLALLYSVRTDAIMQVTVWTSVLTLATLAFLA